VGTPAAIAEVATATPLRQQAAATVAAMAPRYARWADALKMVKTE
jgi:hypothetical protein